MKFIQAKNQKKEFVNPIKSIRFIRIQFKVRAVLLIDSIYKIFPHWLVMWQLDEGWFHVEYRKVTLTEMKCFYFFNENTCCSRYVIPDGETHFALAILPSLPVISWTGYTEEMEEMRNAIAVHRSNVEYTCVMPPGWHGLYLCLKNELVADLNLLPETFWQNSQDPSQAILQVDAIALQGFREFVRWWFVRIQDLHTRGVLNSEAGLILQQELIHEFRSLLDRTFQSGGDRPSVKPSRRYWIFDRAGQIVEANLRQNLTTEDFCQQLGVCQRALQYAFKDMTGVGLKQYILARKLNAVREDLIRADPQEANVTAIASAYGFSHPSRFSQQFHRLFRVHPSTLLEYRRQSTDRF